MQNWDSLQPANYEPSWYNNLFSTKNENHSASTVIDQCFNIKQASSLNLDSSTPSPKNNNNCHETNYVDNNNGITSNSQHPLGFNPLTPPGLPNAVLPSMSFQSDTNNIPQKEQNDVKIDENSLTPRNTPPVDVTPPKSPKVLNNNEVSDRDNDLTSNSSEDIKFLESEDDELIRVPIYNSHGKMKNYKCRHCGFLAITKVAFWNHAREHIKPEKMLQCPKCPFVTELKHHLEYHIRKHKNLKPFQCDKCIYSCVNKSMLNSHLKSHSSIYQYRCSDCDYATKYCHSFKLHLRKYDHKPGLVLDEDGTPNPSVIIDVYGTRRGPKVKSGKIRSSKLEVKREVDFDSKSLFQNEKNKNKQTNHSNINKSTQITSKMHSDKNVTSSMPNFLPNNLANMLHQSRNISLLPYFNLNIQQMIAAQQHATWTQMSPQLQQNVYNSSSCSNDTEIKHKDEMEINHEKKKHDSVINDAMDLSHTNLIKTNDVICSDAQIRQNFNKDCEQNKPIITSSCSKSNTRFSKLEEENSKNNSQKRVLNSEMDTHDNIENNNEDNLKSNCSILDTKVELPSSSSQDEAKFESSDENYNKKICSTSSRLVDCNTSSSSHITSVIPGVYECKYCDIYFKDAVLYTIHMGYHSCDDVFKCNMCGEKCDGPVGLFIHMARNAHS